MAEIVEPNWALLDIDGKCELRQSPTDPNTVQIRLHVVLTREQVSQGFGTIFSELAASELGDNLMDKSITADNVKPKYYAIVSSAAGAMPTVLSSLLGVKYICTSDKIHNEKKGAGILIRTQVWELLTPFIDFDMASPPYNNTTPGA